MSIRRRWDWQGALVFAAIVAIIAFIAWGILVTVRPATGAEMPAELLARMAYSEARSDGVRGMTAVSHVALNRLKWPERFGRTLSAVLRAPHQFKVGPVRSAADQHWRLALWVASGTMQGTLPDITGGATYFHRCNSKRKPAWAAKLTPTVRLGRHCFYRRSP
jgi:N-acetylmuramoyl-L-alanine amidase